MQGPQGMASLLEQTWAGTRPITLEGGQRRTFLEDGDTVTLRGRCSQGSLQIGFGSCTGQVSQALVS